MARRTPSSWYAFRPHAPTSMTRAPALPHYRNAPPPSPRHALLIAPFYPKDPYGSFAKHVLTPAVTMSALAGATPRDWTVATWDENLLQGPPPLDPFPTVVGITVHLTFAQRAYELARWYRKRGAKVVMGGLHVNSCPDEVAPHADAIAVGEGVQLWPRILRDVALGRLQRRYDGSFARPFDAEPLPRRDVVPAPSFLTTASLIATRGCHNRCDFCHLATDGVRMPRQERDVRKVAAEFAASGEPYAVFVDNNLGSHPAYLRRLCAELEPLHKVWSAAVTLDITDDPSLVRAMARAGCTGVFIGLETLDDANLVDAGKRTPRPDDYLRRVTFFQEHGIQVNGSFVFGFDHDRPDVFERTVDWIEEARLECATFHILTPYPGTPLFKRLADDGRLLHTDWSRYDTAHAVFQPRHMTPRLLERGYQWCYRQLFSAGGIWRRRPQTVTDVPPYLLMSTLYKHANRVWPRVIRHRLTRAVWRPLIELGRRRQLRRRQAWGIETPAHDAAPRPECPAAAGQVA